MYTFVCSRAPDEGGFLGVIGVGFGYCAGCDERLKEVAFDGLLIMSPGVVNVVSAAPSVYSHLHPMVSSACISDQDCDLFLWPPFLGF
jgi:hypothetical protein